MAEKSGKNPKEPRPVITRLQWDMPVSMDDKNAMVSLRDYVEGGHGAIAFAALNDVQRAAVAAKRIEMLPGYEMASLGAGVISKQRAVEEVLARTRLGKQLAEIEFYIILKLLDQTKKSEAGKNG